MHHKDSEHKPCSFQGTEPLLGTNAQLYYSQNPSLLCHKRPNNAKTKNDRDCLIQILKDCNKENLSKESIITIPITVLRMLEKVLKKPFNLPPILNITIILEILIQFVLKNLL